MFYTLCMKPLEYKKQITNLREKRNKEILALRKKGKTLEEIGEIFGLSVEGTAKVLRKFHLVDKS